MEPEFTELDTIRLDHDWTWDELAADMARAQAPVNARTLHFLCKRLPVNGHALDRTMHKIRKYLAHVRAVEARAAARARRKVTA
jgi:hypothetical protein